MAGQNLFYRQEAGLSTHCATDLAKRIRKGEPQIRDSLMPEARCSMLLDHHPGAEMSNSMWSDEQPLGTSQPTETRFMTDLTFLRRAIRDSHGCSSQHVASISVHEASWKGVVEVFALERHSSAKYAYAWSYRNDSGKINYVAILDLPPVDSATDAVKAYLASNLQRSRT